MSPAPGQHPDDVFHVLLDAIASHRKAIQDGDATWRDYGGGDPDDDPKVTAAGYLSVLDQAEALATAALDCGRSEAIVAAAVKPTSGPVIEFSPEAAGDGMALARVLAFMAGLTVEVHSRPTVAGEDYSVLTGEVVHVDYRGLNVSDVLIIQRPPEDCHDEGDVGRSYIDVDAIDKVVWL